MCKKNLWVILSMFLLLGFEPTNFWSYLIFLTFVRVKVRKNQTLTWQKLKLSFLL